MVYLFVGADHLSKEIKLRALKAEFLQKQTEQFNFDVLYARDLTLRGLQEKLLFLPLKSKKRILVVKGAQQLKEELKEFLLRYARKPQAEVILILDIDNYASLAAFIREMPRNVRVMRFKEELSVDTFTLARAIESKSPERSLRLLNQLLQDGERPERILGGLRYSCERDTAYSLGARRKLRLLLNCDIQIKTGRLKPVFALEKLVVELCARAFKPFH